MKRYYSHYTFIYPDVYLKNYIVELDENRKIVHYFPFEKEIEKTEFYSGLLIFVPQDIGEKGLQETNIVTDLNYTEGNYNIIYILMNL